MHRYAANVVAGEFTLLAPASALKCGCISARLIPRLLPEAAFYHKHAPVREHFVGARDKAPIVEQRAGQREQRGVRAVVAHQLCNEVGVIPARLRVRTIARFVSLFVTHRGGNLQILPRGPRYTHVLMGVCSKHQTHLAVIMRIGRPAHESLHEADRQPAARRGAAVHHGAQLAGVPHQDHWAWCAR